MPATAPSAPPESDEQIISRFTRLTFAFCGALAMVLALGVTFLIPHGSVRTRGMIIGGALGLCSWFGSRWITRYALVRGARTGPTEMAGAVGTAAFMGIGVAETSALVGLALAFGEGGDVGSFVIAIPIAIAAIIVNASGPSAIRRHLDTLRA